MMNPPSGDRRRRRRRHARWPVPIAPPEPGVMIEFYLDPIRIDNPPGPPFLYWSLVEMVSRWGYTVEFRSSGDSRDRSSPD